MKLNEAIARLNDSAELLRREDVSALQCADFLSATAARLVAEGIEPITYKPSLLCRLVGHKWWLRNINERIEHPTPTNRVKHRDVTRTQHTHCDRCGIPNPSYPK